jgi:hypothetical protein
VINNKGRRLHPLGAFGPAAFCVILPIGLLGAGQWPEPLRTTHPGTGRADLLRKAKAAKDIAI